MPIQLFSSKSLYHSRIEITEPCMTSFHQICFCDFNKGSRKYINWKLFTMVNIKLMIFNKGRTTWTNPSGRSHSERAVHSLEWPYGWTEYHYNIIQNTDFTGKEKHIFSCPGGPEQSNKKLSFQRIVHSNKTMMWQKAEVSKAEVWLIFHGGLSPDIIENSK